MAGTTYELLRTVTGRRTRAQADAALDWGDVPEASGTLLSVYGWSA